MAVLGRRENAQLEERGLGRLHKVCLAKLLWIRREFGTGELGIGISSPHTHGFGLGLLSSLELVASVAGLRYSARSFPKFRGRLQALGNLVPKVQVQA